MRIKIFLAIIFLLSVVYYFSLPKKLFDVSYSTVVESRDGRLLSAKIADDGQWRFPTIDSVPTKFKAAIICFEDKRFDTHLGVDFAAVGRAIKQNIQQNGVVSGASTLTMQTIRLSRNRQRTITEKIVEAILATRAEWRYTKDEILMLYCSHAPFGGNVVGLDAAAWRYFGRSAHELSWAESAMLAVLPNAPSLIHLGRNRDKLMTKRNRLLDRMLEQGVIDSLDCELAKEESLPDRPYPIPMLTPFLLDSTRRTTINYELQRRVLNTMEQHNEIYRSNKVENLAAMVVDVRSGDVLAYVGNMYEVGDVSRGSCVDVITAPRSSGSVLKPFLYGAMIDDAKLLPTMLLPDIPTYFKHFTPRNFNNSFDGAVPAYRVLERSLNVPSVLMQSDYGTDKFIYLLQKLGLRTINKSADHYGLSLILGGAEITMWDLVGAYSRLSAKLGGGDVYKISLDDEKVKIREEDIPISNGAIWLTFEALLDVNRPEEEGDWRMYESSRRVAWKTGTSYGNRDAWAVGVTPEYVVCVWVGNSSGEGRPLLTGVGYAAPVLFDIFGLLPPTNWFSAPEIELEEVVICAKSGFVASSICTERDTLMLPTQSLNAPVCPYHKMVNLSSDLKYRVSSDCYSVSQMEQRSWFVLPPVMEWYYRRKNLDYQSLPPLISGEVGENPIEIIYPQRDRVVVLTRGIDAREQGVVFSAVHRDLKSTIYWHIDDNYIGATVGEHKVKVRPEKGRHQLTLVDERGASRSVVFYCDK